MHGDFIAAAKFNQGAVAREIADVQLLALVFLFQQHPAWAGAVGEFASAFKDISEGMAAGVNFESLFLFWWHKDVKVLRISGDAVHRPGFAPERPHDHLHDGAIVIHDFRNVVGFDVLVARRGHLESFGQVGPKLEAMHLALGVALRHFLMQDARPCGHPLHIAAFQRAAIAKTVAVINRAREDIGDGFNAAMRMPRKTRHVITRGLPAEIVEQQEGVELGWIAKAEGAVQMHACAFDMRLGGGLAEDGAEGHGKAPLIALSPR